VDEETSTIKRHIDNEREQLGRNLDELEYRVKSATDLKTHFNRNTGWILGAAVAGGFLLSRVVGRSSTSEASPRWEPRERTEPNASRITQRLPSHLGRVSETVDNIFEGLVGVVSDKLQSFVADAVPGFREQFDAVERQHGRKRNGL
jgi:hypothetical protein